jgi:uncharacterized protein with HEPN domain
MDGTTKTPTADVVLRVLRSHEAELRAAGLRRLSLSGSVARGEDDADSDVDLPDEPWADIRGTGNRLRHGYDRLGLRVIWAAASERVPSLATSARNVLAKLDEVAGGNRTG